MLNQDPNNLPGAVSHRQRVPEADRADATSSTFKSLSGQIKCRVRAHDVARVVSHGSTTEVSGRPRQTRLGIKVKWSTAESGAWMLMFWGGRTFSCSVSS